MDLNKKIEQIIIDKGISPSYFADTVGIQRSSISHILSGRNKPSLDIIQRILKVFPDIDRDWLLFDSDVPQQNAPQINRQNTANQRVISQNSFEQTSRESNRNYQPEPNVVQTPVNVTPRRKIERPVVPTQQPLPSGKQIERIVIFYTDGTFMESKPN
ncbi:helix-turn-helix protein [Arcicella aurantiaca]|uniref:Helix-turn-helix protein n=1 Tax=Arcicella aurantiaca TaxID=591202 RepID=A0A316E9N7_9BACT|nr:helix-turn-helix transcriptional regulator [Arcicella aurantiaca]PWK27087.1 helix-turn-helix protein [Arcicella aurantiaca]